MCSQLNQAKTGQKGPSAQNKNSLSVAYHCLHILAGAIGLKPNWRIMEKVKNNKEPK